MIIGISPVRLSFSGGGTDMPEFYNQNGGNVVTASINRYTYSIFHPRYDSKFQTFSPDFERHIRPTKFSQIIIESGTEIALAAVKYLKYHKGTNVIVVICYLVIFSNFPIVLLALQTYPSFS